MKQKVIIEARVNEYATREDGNLHVPYTPEEIAEAAAQCREAGAAIVHFHAREADGSPGHQPHLYGETIAKIRQKSDILVHPTLGYVTLGPKEQRISHIAALANDPVRRPDFAPVDMGSVNVDKYDARRKTYLSENLVYTNSTETLRYLIEKINATGIKLYVVSWNIGFTRITESFLEMGLVPEPVFLCFCLTDSWYLGGHPGTIRGLQAHLDFLPRQYRIEWTVCNFGGNVFPAAAAAIAEGGHVSIGLGDWAYPELGYPANAELIHRTVGLVREMGREVATPDEARELLAIRK